MSRILDYLSKSVYGVGRYLDANKMVVFVFAVLLVIWLTEKKHVGGKANRFFTYTLVMIILLLFPITAAMVLFYQTAFYDYEWAWSLVPVTAVIAYGFVILLEHNFPKGKKILGALLAVALLCLCGNQGMLQVVSSEEALVREDIDDVIRGIYSFEVQDEKVLWAPKRVMQEVRRKDGKILLIYGRDIWDEKAGAYDYEAYSEEITHAYAWLEDLVKYGEIANGLENPADSLILFSEQYELDKDTEKSIELMMKAGVNTIVLPNLVAMHLEEVLLEIASGNDKELEKTYTEDYTIYAVN